MLLSYLAGAIDADGTIGIKKSTYSMRVTGDSTRPTYSERVALRQVTRVVPELLRDTFGGTFYEHKGQGKGKNLFSWQITDMKCAAAVRLLLPYLRIKKDQALNVLDLRKTKEQSKRFRVRRGRGHAGSSGRSDKHSNRMEALYIEAKRLNTVGV